MYRFESYDNPSSISTAFDHHFSRAAQDHHTNYNLLSPTDSQTSIDGMSTELLEGNETSTQTDGNQPLDTSSDTFLGTILNSYFHERKSAVEFARETARKFGFNILVRTSRPNYAVLVCACRTRKQPNLKAYQAASVYSSENGIDRPKRALGRKPKRQETGCKFHVILRRETADVPWQFRQSRDMDHNHHLPVVNSGLQTHTSASSSMEVSSPIPSSLHSKQNQSKSLTRQIHENINFNQNQTSNQNVENFQRNTVSYTPIDNSFDVQPWNPMDPVRRTSPASSSHISSDTSSPGPYAELWRLSSVQTVQRQSIVVRTSPENIQNMGLVGDFPNNPTTDDPARQYFEGSIASPYGPNDILFPRYMEAPNHGLGFADSNLNYMTHSELTYPITPYPFQ